MHHTLLAWLAITGLAQTASESGRVGADLSRFQEPLAMAAPAAEVTPAPLYRDPVHDGAADPVLVWNPRRDAWWLFYTQRPTPHARSERRVSASRMRGEYEPSPPKIVHRTNRRRPRWPGAGRRLLDSCNVTNEHAK